MKGLTVPMVFLALLGKTCAGESAGVAAFRTMEWKPVFQGVGLGSAVLAKPRPVRALVLRVRLGTPGLSMLATPDNGAAPGETTGQRTSGFLKMQGCQAAINAAPFDKVSSFEGEPLNIGGLQVSGGKVVSPADKSPALLFMNDGRARIQRPPFPDKGIKEAVAGFQVVRWLGRTVGTDLKLHPRTGAGISADGKTLWLLVVDGRQTGISEGCTTVEMGDWLGAMGAVSGINLDGGGTTTMVLEDATGKPVILNRPIHGGIPGLERPAGSHLGVRTRRLVQ
jgi:Phosphodiester glycosidase